MTDAIVFILGLLLAAWLWMKLPPGGPPGAIVVPEECLDAQAAPLDCMPDRT